MKRHFLITILCVVIFVACADDSDRPLNDCNHPTVEAIVFMRNDPFCFDVHADIQITVSDGNTDYVLLELLFDRDPPWNIPYSEIMTFDCVESLQVDFMCYSDEVWTRSEGSMMIPVSCGEFVYIDVYADTINPLSTYKDGFSLKVYSDYVRKGYTAFELEDDFKCAEAESLYFAWGSYHH